MSKLFSYLNKKYFLLTQRGSDKQGCTVYGIETLSLDLKTLNKGLSNKSMVFKVGVARERLISFMQNILNVDGVGLLRKLIWH